QRRRRTPLSFPDPCQLSFSSEISGPIVSSLTRPAVKRQAKGRGASGSILCQSISRNGLKMRAKSLSIEHLEDRLLLSVTPVIRVLDNQTTILAGETIHAQGVPTKSGVSTQLGAGSAVSARFQWDFGDPKGSYDLLPGFNAAHVYDRPGA